MCLRCENNGYSDKKEKCSTKVVLSLEAIPQEVLSANKITRSSVKSVCQAMCERIGKTFSKIRWD